MVNAFPSDLPGLLSADAKDQSNAKSENVKLQEQEQFLDLVWVHRGSVLRRLCIREKLDNGLLAQRRDGLWKVREEAWKGRGRMDE